MLPAPENWLWSSFSFIVRTGRRSEPCPPGSTNDTGGQGGAPEQGGGPAVDEEAEGGGVQPGAEAPNDPERRMEDMQAARSRVKSTAEHDALKYDLMVHLCRLSPEA